MKKKSSAKIAVLREKAYSLYLEKKWKDAIKAFNELLKHRDDERYHIKLAECYLKEGNKKGAVDEYIKAVESYMKKGFRLQAVSVLKIIQNIAKEDERIEHLMEEVRREEEEERKMREEEIRERERKIPPPMLFFSALSKEEFENVLENFRLLSFHKGEMIMQEGEVPSSFYILVYGEVGIFHGEKKISQLCAGSFIAQKSFFCQTPLRASVIALTEVEVFEVNDEEIASVMERYPAVKEAVEEIYRKHVLIPVLKAHPIFDGIPQEEIENLSSYFTFESIKEGETVIQEGEPGDALYLIRTGAFDVFKKVNDEFVHLAELGPGEIFGEISLVTGKKTTATVVAKVISSVMSLSRDGFLTIAMAYPVVLDKLSLIAENRIKKTRETLNLRLNKDGVV